MSALPELTPTPTNSSNLTPELTNRGLTFWPIPEFDDMALAFGANASAYFDRRDLPEIPRSFEKKASDLFFKGGGIEVSDDIDALKATRAIRAWLSSFAPSHESKEATVAYALWCWSDEALEARKSLQVTA